MLVLSSLLCRSTAFFRERGNRKEDVIVCVTFLTALRGPPRCLSTREERLLHLNEVAFDPAQDLCKVEFSFGD